MVNLRQSEDAIPFEILARMGKVGEFEPVHKFGRFQSVGTTPVDLWSGGGDYPWQSATVSIEFLSNSANDAAAGTGLRTVTAVGLLGGAPQTATATLNGTSPVAVTEQFDRIFGMYGGEVGSGGKNAGTITCRVAGGGAKLASIEVISEGRGQSLEGIYTVRSDRDLIVTRVAGQILEKANVEVDVELFSRQGEGYCWRGQGPVPCTSTGTSNSVNAMDTGMIFPGGSDLALRATASTTSVDVGGWFCGWLVPK